jgi:GDP-mannose 6-dehydrogenase
LPKDLRALNYKAKSLDLEVPILNSILPSNATQTKKGLQMIVDKGNRKIGVLGFSFKAGTDDLRESPIVEVIERLYGKGYDIKIYDKNVSLAKLVGANRDYILNIIPHISKMMVESLDEIYAHAETLVVGNGSEEFHDVLERASAEQVVVDLVRISDGLSREGIYDGICW